jgi:hypothetical protein
MKVAQDDRIHNLVKNLDFSLRRGEKKSILIASDLEKEGKSTFIRECAPVLCDLYKRKVLIFDCQPERQDQLEQSLAPISINDQYVRNTSFANLDYVHAQDVLENKSTNSEDQINALNAYYNLVSKDYDVILINMKTLKRAEKTLLPSLPIDGAILVRTAKTISGEKKPITDEIKDKEIPVIGIVLNEGI